MSPTISIPHSEMKSNDLDNYCNLTLDIKEDKAWNITNLMKGDKELTLSTMTSCS